ncbi:MAG: tyrosine--tRNA ligase [Candidatus Saccharibacteria bacterium]|nr:tyrosine--tRNA ligase [Candidatus Saccharibacteria bacterium]
MSEEKIDSQNQALIDELCTRGVDKIYPNRESLIQKLSQGKVLIAYMGIDPTAPDIHVGHQSQLLKLGRLQRLGHKVILLIGDFTAMIGDPTDKSAARVRLTREQVLENAKGYIQQASKIIDFDEGSENPATVVYNSSWLSEMDFADVLELTSEFTVQQMLARRTFKDRIRNEKPVGLHEFIYPTMQGWDSVRLDVDIEIGGTDQIFNMLCGTDLVARHNKKQKFVIAGQLLVDPSGKKIGKTEGNMITMNDKPSDMFHKIMMWGDDITPHALELCTDMPMEKVRKIETDLKEGNISGIEGKKILAREVVSKLHGEDAVKDAEATYESLSQTSKEINVDELETYEPNDGESIIDILCGSGLAPTKSQARRLLEQNAVRLNDLTLTLDFIFGKDPKAGQLLLQVGKKKRGNFRVLQK